MKLIINADDFGISKSVTDGIIVGIKAGVLTSTTIMSNMEWADYAISESLKNKINCIGLHVNLTMGKPLTKCSSLCDNEGKFFYFDKQVLNDKIIEKEVFCEIIAQLEFVENRGLKIDHIDWHNDLEKNRELMDKIVQIAKEKNMPMRNANIPEQKEIKTPDICNQEFFGKSNKGVSMETLIGIINEYKNTNKTIEIMSHSGYMDDYTKSITFYRHREQELEILLKAKKEGLFSGIEMISFREL